MIPLFSQAGPSSSVAVSVSAASTRNVTAAAATAMWCVFCREPLEYQESSDLGLAVEFGSKL